MLTYSGWLMVWIRYFVESAHLRGTGFCFVRQGERSENFWKSRFPVHRARLSRTDIVILLVWFSGLDYLHFYRKKHCNLFVRVLGAGIGGCRSGVLNGGPATASRCWRIFKHVPRSPSAVFVAGQWRFTPQYGGWTGLGSNHGYHQSG